MTKSAWKSLTLAPAIAALTLLGAVGAAHAQTASERTVATEAVDVLVTVCGLDGQQARMAAAQARPGYESNMLEGGYSRSFGADGVPQVNVDPVSSATTCIVEVKHEGVGMRAAIRSSVEALAGRLAMELLQDAAPQPADSDQGPFRQSMWSMVHNAARISILVREYDKATWGDDLIETNLYLLTSAAE